MYNYAETIGRVWGCGIGGFRVSSLGFRVVFWLSGLDKNPKP